jgi:hypothetical protein
VYSNRRLGAGIGATAGPLSEAIATIGDEIRPAHLLLHATIRAAIGAPIGYGFGWWLDARRVTEADS